MRFFSPHADLHLPPADTTLAGLLLAPVARQKEQGEGAPSASSSSSRIDTPFLYPSPTNKALVGRPQAAPLSLRETHARAYRLAKGLLDGRLGGEPFQKGDVVAFYASNQHDYVPAILGIQLAGGIAALCNPSYQPHELAHQLRMTSARCIITIASGPTQPAPGSEQPPRSTPLANALEAAKLAHEDDDEKEAGAFERLGTAPFVLLFDHDHEKSIDTILAPDTLQAQDIAEVDARRDSIKGSDAAVYCFSSGTSGLPKAVILTHRNLVANTIQATFLLHDRMNEPLNDGKQYSPDGKTGWYDGAEEHGAGREVAPASEQQEGQTGGKSNGSKKIAQGGVKGVVRLFKDTLSIHPSKADAKQPNDEGARDVAHRPNDEQEFHIDVLPQFHCYGLLVNLVALHTCTPRIILPRFHLETYLELVNKHHVTFGFVVPPIVLALAKQPVVDKYDVSSLWRVASGAASLPDEIAHAVGARLDIRCTDGYGMTEMSPIIAMQTVRDIERAPDTVGALAPNTEALVLGEDGKQMGAGEVGELALRGPQMMAGYLRNEEATRSAFKLIDNGDGEQIPWLLTGDVVKIDERGYVKITDRLKDVIKAKGFQVSPAELEALVFKDERVQDVAVVGVKDPKDGSEQPWAFIVLRDAQDRSDESMRTILDGVNKRVAGYKKIAGATWLDALPKSDAGKVLKKELRAHRDA